MSYFVPGAWHLAAAMAFAVTFGVLGFGEPTFWLRQPLFCVALVVSSCAFFFVPDGWAKKGLLKFLHYPLPDWDVLLLGPASHRHWLFHSPLGPLLVLGALWKWPHLAAWNGLAPLSVGLGIGVGSHLFWDCVGSQKHTVVFVPHWFKLREASSRLYLLIGAATCLCIAWALATAWAFAPEHGDHSIPSQVEATPVFLFDALF